MKKLNIIVPCYNEEENIEHFYKSVKSSLNNVNYEIIFVNDGSTDNTLKEIKQIYKKDKKHIKIIDFSRNFNKDAAIYAGLQYSNSKYTCIIDADLQQNPKYINKMITFLDKNDSYDQIAMVNNNRKENKLIIFFKKAFYKILDLISDIKFVNSASDFRLMRRNVVEAILLLSEKNRFSKGIFSWIGFNTYYMDYEVEKRNNGKSKFNLKNSIKYAFEGIFNFSIKPLRIATIFGLISSIIAFCLFVEVIIEKIFFNIPVSGYPTIMCTVLFLGGINLIAVGILGEYLAKTYLETKQRPVYIIKEKYGFKD